MHSPIVSRKIYQIVFLIAGIYNITWGLYSSIQPQWFFHVARMEPMRHPEIFATLGMVVGLYGILYLAVARSPDRGWLIVAVGLAGKILGPIGMTLLILSGAWPVRAGVLILTNDLIWWIPFGLYLYDYWPQDARRVIDLVHLQ